MDHVNRAFFREPNALMAIGSMCLYVGLIVCVNAIGKVLTGHMHPLEVVFFRHAGAGAFLFVIFVSRYGVRVLRTNRPVLQTIRGLFAIVSSMFYFTALASASLATAAAISFTAPLILTALSGPVLGENVGPHRWGAVIVGFAGAPIVVRPGIGGAGSWAALMLLGSATCTGLYQLLTRKLAGQDRAETTSVLSGLIGGGVVTLAIPFVWTTPDHWWVWALSLALGVIGGTGHFLLTMAFERGPASLLSPFNYLQLLGATVTGYTLYGDLPDRVTWLGAAAIVAAGLYIGFRAHRTKTKL